VHPLAPDKAMILDARPADTPVTARLCCRFGEISCEVENDVLVGLAPTTVTNFMKLDLAGS
jgi:hypothetical protein